MMKKSKISTKALCFVLGVFLNIIKYCFCFLHQRRKKLCSLTSVTNELGPTCSFVLSHMLVIPDIQNSPSLPATPALTSHIHNAGPVRLEKAKYPPGLLKGE